MHNPLKSSYTLMLSLSLVVGYGVFSRLIFGLQGLGDYLGGVVTLGFIFGVPMVLGAATILLLPQRYKTSWVQAIFMPWITCVAVTALIGIFALEAVFCIVLGLPIFLPMASLGGVLTWLLLQKRSKDNMQMSLVIFLLAPYFVAMVENRFPTPDSYRAVASQIVINAPAGVVWQQITSVPKIQPDEHHLALFHVVGVPRPVQAMLPVGSVGAVRQSSYEGGLHFVERVITWQPEQGFSFTIDLDPQVETPWPWDQVGGPYFELLDGTYRIEPVSDRQVILHLGSRHRLSTKFNAYGGLWTDFILGDIQNYILAVVKRRAEAAA